MLAMDYIYAWIYILPGEMIPENNEYYAIFHLMVQINFGDLLQ